MPLDKIGAGGVLLSVKLRKIRNHQNHMTKSHLILAAVAVVGLLVGVAVKGYVDAHSAAAPAA